MSRTQLLSLFLPFAASLCDAVMLPSVPAAPGSSKTVPGDWWVQAGDHVYYTPPASLLGLSQNVSDYYYVQGSKSALTPRMNEHLVGSQGRWHIMHLPEGQSMLEVSAQSCSNGDRRSSVSSLTQLKSGTILSSGFPVYDLQPTYQHPLDEDGQALEKKAVAHVGHDTAMNYLEKLVNDVPTRSYTDSVDSVKVEDFLKKELELLGLHTCYHNFNAGDTSLTNVIAHVPGTEEGAVIVGAHYDSRPFEGAAPGAEDNGSGVAALLAMAKAFTHAMGDKKPKKSVWFTLFAGEEPGLLGSKHFANDLKELNLPDECFHPSSPSFLQTAQEKFLSSKRFMDRPRLAKKTFQASAHSAIIMDEIGWLSPKMTKPTVNLESYDSSKEVMDHLKHSSEDHNGALIEVVHSSNPFGSDHMPFLENKIGAVLTINGDDEAYPHYHKSSDKIRNEDGTYNVDAGLMSMITKMNTGAMMRMAL